MIVIFNCLVTKAGVTACGTGYDLAHDLEASPYFYIASNLPICGKQFHNSRRFGNYDRASIQLAYFFYLRMLQ